MLDLLKKILLFVIIINSYFYNKLYSTMTREGAIPYV